MPLRFGNKLCDDIMYSNIQFVLSMKAYVDIIQYYVKIIIS